MNQILLDTNVFNDKLLLKSVKIHSQNGNVQAFVNPVIYLELGYIFRVRHKFHVFKKVLEEAAIKCISLSARTAEQASHLAIDFKDDPRGAHYFFRDCLIGATALENDLVLITANKKDFPYLTKKWTPLEFIEIM